MPNPHAARCPHCARSCRAIPLNPRVDSHLHLLSCTHCDQTAWTAAGAVITRAQALRLLAGKPDFAMAPTVRPKTSSKGRRAAV